MKNKKVFKEKVWFSLKNSLILVISLSKRITRLMPYLQYKKITPFSIFHNELLSRSFTTIKPINTKQPKKKQISILHLQNFDAV